MHHSLTEGRINLTVNTFGEELIFMVYRHSNKCLKQIMVARIYASHLRVWQTQLSNIASSCFDIDKTLYLTNITLVLWERCVTPVRVKSYIICLLQSKRLNV